MGLLTIKRKCWVCGGDGIYMDIPCLTCLGNGKVDIAEGIETIDITEVTDKLQEIKTKINKMQADINYIKAKVG